MNIPLDALVTAGAAVFGSLSTYAGQRVMSRRAQATENRKVDLAEFELFKKSYMETIRDFRERYEEQEKKMEKVERLLRLALQHIRDLRRDMQEHQVPPTHPTPVELETLLWTLPDGSAKQGE